jgi:predicted dehydrogenase
MSIMHYSDLAQLWRIAELPLEIVVVGGGRWGKVWVSVIADAQKTVKNISMVARADPQGVRDWLKQNSKLNAISVYQSIDEAVIAKPHLKAAIVCSRPQNHLADTLDAYKHDLHVLVEKPMSTDAVSSGAMANRAQAIQRILTVGTEFSYLPALHQCAQEFISQPKEKKITLTWEDPEGEARHGSKKIRHGEDTLLNDLLPHAFSIFSVLASNNRLNISRAFQHNGGLKGVIQFQDQSSNLYQLNCNVSANKRTRLLEIKGSASSAVLNFSEQRSCLTINDCSVYPPSSIVEMTSTLRLELGAFVSQIVAPIKEEALDLKIEELIDLQYQLEKTVARPISRL